MKDFVLDPPLWFIFLGYAPLTAVAYQGFVAFFIGLLMWSLWEYSIHRWILHGVLNASHRVHHINQSRCISLPLFVSAGGSLGFGLLFPTNLAGVLTGYLAYETAHRLPIPWHKSHHEDSWHSFGVTTPLWDYAFCTK